MCARCLRDLFRIAEGEKETRVLGKAGSPDTTSSFEKSDVMTDRFYTTVNMPPLTGKIIATE